MIFKMLHKRRQEREERAEKERIRQAKAKEDYWYTMTMGGGYFATVAAKLNLSDEDKRREEAFRLGRMYGLDVSAYSDPKYSVDQMEWIFVGLYKYKIDISSRIDEVNDCADFLRIIKEEKEK